MGDAGFYRGTSSEQDSRFTDKERKLLKQMRFDGTLDEKICMDRVNLDVLKPWITAKLNEILGVEDDVLIEYVFSQLEEKTLNPKVMQINLTGFLNARRAREFMGELWGMLLEAQSSKDGIPASLVEKKMKEIQEKAKNASITTNGAAEAAGTDWKNRYESFTGGKYGQRDRKVEGVKEEPYRDDDQRREYRDSDSNRTRLDRSANRSREEPQDRDRESDERRVERRRDREERQLRDDRRSRDERDRHKSRSPTRRHVYDERNERKKARSNSLKESPPRRRFTERKEEQQKEQERGSTHRRRKRESASSDSEKERTKKKKKSKHSKRHSDSESERVEKKRKKRKKEKKRKKTHHSSDSE